MHFSQEFMVGNLLPHKSCGQTHSAKGVKQTFRGALPVPRMPADEGVAGCPRGHLSPFQPARERLALVCRRGKQGAARNDGEYKHATTLMCNIETHSFSFFTSRRLHAAGGGGARGQETRTVSLPKETEEKLLPAK